MEMLHTDATHCNKDMSAIMYVSAILYVTASKTCIEYCMSCHKTSRCNTLQQMRHVYVHVDGVQLHADAYMCHVYDLCWRGICRYMLHVYPSCINNVWIMCNLYTIHCPVPIAVCITALCSIPQHTATHCNTLQNPCITLQHIGLIYGEECCMPSSLTATHDNTLQHTATRCIMLHHAASHWYTLQHTQTICREARINCCMPSALTATRCNLLQHAAIHCCHTLQRTATHCNALQRMATHTHDMDGM